VQQTNPDGLIGCKPCNEIDEGHPWTVSAQGDSTSSNQEANIKTSYHTYDVKVFQDRLLRWHVLDQIPVADIYTPAVSQLAKTASPGN